MFNTRRLLSPFVLLVLLTVFLTQAERIVSISVDAAAPYIATLTGIGAVLLLVALAWALNSLRQQPVTLAWRASWRAFNPLWLLGSAGLLILFALLSQGGDGEFNVTPARIVETFLPLVLGMQAALLFSPADEPALEIMLACPRGIGWLLLERLLLLGLVQGTVALAGILLSWLLLPEQDLALLLLRWLPPTLLLTGVGIYITLRSRVAAFGLAMAGVVWFAAFFFAPMLLPGGLELFFPVNYIQLFLWGVSPYLQPTDLGADYYWLNRACVLVLGLGLLFASLWTLRNEEQLLSSNKG